MRCPQRELTLQRPKVTTPSLPGPLALDRQVPAIPDLRFTKTVEIHAIKRGRGGMSCESR